MSLNEKDKELIDLLNKLSLKNNKESISNQKEQSIVAILLSAHTENRVDEYIEIVKNNADKTINEIMGILFADSQVEIVDDEE